MLEIRYRAGKMQENLNIELGLLTRQNFSSQTGIAGGGSVGGAIGATGGGSLLSTSAGGGGGRGGLCFAGETLFTLYGDSYIRFDALFEQRNEYIGRFAKSFDEFNQTVKGEITDIFKSIAYEYALVTFADGETVRVKPNHRYFTPSGEYVEIARLLGEKVASETHEKIGVAAIEIVNVPEGIKVYNATIKDFHNYCAGKKRVSNNKRPDFPDIE